MRGFVLDFLPFIAVLTPVCNGEMLFDDTRDRRLAHPAGM